MSGPASAWESASIFRAGGQLSRTFRFALFSFPGCGRGSEGRFHAYFTMRGLMCVQ